MENASGGLLSPRIVLAGLGLALAALVLATGGRAAEPSTGTVGPTSSTVAWQGETYTLSNLPGGPQDCPANDPDDATCDHFTLTVDADAAYWSTHDGGVRIRIEWLNPADDFDLYVYDSAGNEVGRSAAGPSNVEEAFVTEPSGTLNVLVVPFLVSSSAYSGTATFESEATTPSGPGPYFFHGEPTDDANKLPGPPDPTATFDTSEPTDPVPASQGMTEVANQDFAKNFLAAFWTGEFSGTINGSLELDWWWSTTGGAALGAQVSVTVFADAPAGGGVVPPEQIIGRKQLTVTAGPTPVENVHLVPVQGTVDRDLTIQVALVSSGADDIRVHYDSPDFRSRFLVTDRQLTVNETPAGVDGLASAPAQGLAFSASVPAEHQRDESEPLIEINKDGHMFTCGPTGFSNASDYAQVSTDGGDQFQLLGTPPRGQQGAGGGGDCGLAFGTSRNAQGNYQYAYTGLGPLTGFVTSTSANNGHNLVTGGPFGNGVTNKGGGADRQWNVFVDDHTVLLSYNQQAPRNVVIQRSTDGGLTYGPDAAVGAPTPLFPGPMRYDEARDIVYFPWDSFEDHVNLSISRDKGLTWTACHVAANDGPAAGFVTAEHDSAGNIYVAWAVEGSYHTYMSSLPAAKVAECDDPVTPNGPQPTTNPGWSTPVQVDRDAVRSTVFPWLTAGGAPGRVAITFYGTESDGDPNLGSFKGAWDVYVNQSLNALAPDATFSQVKATTHPFHYDSICLNGLGCDLAAPPGDRTLADFFAIDWNPRTDRLAVVFNRTNKKPDEASGHVANVMVVNQIGGPTIGGALASPTRPVVRTTSTDPSGDALSSYSILGPPSPPPPTANEPAADFVSLALGPEIDLHTGALIADGGFTATIKLAELSTGSLLGTMSRTGAQSLLWLVRFSNGHQDVAATARWNPVEGFTFGYNDYTTASAQCGSSGEKCVVYPGGTPIQGDADQAKGVIRLSVPRFLLRALGPPDASGRPTEAPAANGTRLYDVTAISVGNTVSPVQALQSFLYPLDTTPSMDYLLGSGGGGGGGGGTGGCTVSGGGSIAAAGGEGRFSVDAHGDGRGKVDYRDGDTDFRSSGSLVLTCTGTTARLEGSGFVERNKPVTYTVDVADNGESGATDTFSIRLSNGKTAAGTLTRGNVQVRPR